MIGGLPATPVFRHFTALDQRGFAALIEDGLRERLGDVFDPNYNADLADITASYTAQGATVAVGVDDSDTIVATGIMVPITSTSGRLVRMSVHRDARRRGLGRAMVDHLISSARQHGMTELHVETDTPWTSAVALYTSCGFEVTSVDAQNTHFRVRLKPV